MGALKELKGNAELDSFVADNPNVVVEFWAVWCGPCRVLGPILETMAEDRADLAIAKINSDDHSEVATRFGVMSIPTMLIFKGGELKGQIIGAKPRVGLERELEKLGV